MLSVRLAVKCIYNTDEGTRDADLNDITDRYKGRARFWIALNSGKVVGTVAIEKKDEATAYLRRMFVLPNYHGKQVGRMLFEQAMNFAKEHKYTRVDLTTHTVMKRAHRFYEKNGFIKTGMTDDSYEYRLELGKLR